MTSSSLPILPESGAHDRACWCDVAIRLATPVLESLAQRKLHAVMPVERNEGRPGDPGYPGDPREHSHLEAFARLLAGLAPWLELPGEDTAEGRERARYGALAREGLDAATDPGSPDCLNFSRGRQPLVDAAFLAQALLRAPGALWERLTPRVRRNVVTAIASSRGILPSNGNWRLFATMVEIFLHRAGGRRDDARLFEGIAMHRDWYLGDGMYGDGPEFHWDYYNSFVIQPMLVEALGFVGDEAPEWAAFRDQARARLTRWAAIQERLIAPDGSYPIIGRSIAYRCGAFQGLALAAWRHLLPAGLPPAQARTALTAVIRRTLEAPGTWDARGWLRIGLAGHQPQLGENYISTGSLYLCATALLPLGLPATDPFWAGPNRATTWQRGWSGEDLPADHHLS
ncbi:MAG TPA: DUF2264 domain-containing protein [Lacunisphaera sp.]|nr:DUF2264 domain-containing protein [Lacunisphaera sp.]